MRILIVEDNEDLAANTGDYLEAQGHAVDYAGDGLGGVHLVATNAYDAVVLDLGLPGMDGLTLCRRIRHDLRKDVPVLMVTARDTLAEKLAGFEAGTDDYLVKPFALQELDARLQALVRRSRGSTTNVLVHADLELDLDRVEARRGGRRLHLNPACLTILRVLLEAAPAAVRRAQLERALWAGEPPESDALRSHIYALRRAIDRPFERPLLQTIHGIGYRIADPDNEAAP